MVLSWHKKPGTPVMHDLTMVIGSTEEYAYVREAKEPIVRNATTGMLNLARSHVHR